MRYYYPSHFIAAIRGAPVKHKREWIHAHVIGKEVLDLGVVDHSLDFCLNHREQWLHGIISDSAALTVGVDVLEAEVNELRKMGYNVIGADALTLRLNQKFDVVICGDLIEHVTNPEALLDTIAYHLRDDGIAVVTTPNPLAINRFFNILADGWTDINTEHVSWFCPQTMFQLVERSSLFVDDLCWLDTDFPMWTQRRVWGRLCNFVGPQLARKNKLLHNDYGVVLRKKPRLSQNPTLYRPFVSVILTTYNRADYLEGAFRSLSSQDYPPERFEIIVVDNASTDDTPQRVRRLARETEGKSNIKYIREERPGLVFARHTGAAHAKGDILLFGDDDAIFDKNWISAIVAVYGHYPEVGAVGTKIAIQWDRDPEPRVRPYEGVLGKLDYGKEIIVRRGLFINGGSFSIRKRVLLQLYGFNPGQRGQYILGDSETGLCRKLANAEILVAWTPAATMWHRQRAATNGTLSDLKRRFRNNGICDAYHATYYNWKFSKLLYDVLRKTSQMLRKLLGTIRRRDWEGLHYDVALNMAYYQYYVRYLWLYRLSPTIRSEVIKRDWEFNHNYEAPPVVFNVHRMKADSGYMGNGPLLEKNGNID